jgi:hypothetical protein
MGLCSFLASIQGIVRIRGSPSSARAGFRQYLVPFFVRFSKHVLTPAVRRVRAEPPAARGVPRQSGIRGAKNALRALSRVCPYAACNSRACQEALTRDLVRSSLAFRRLVQPVPVWSPCILPSKSQAVADQATPFSPGWWICAALRADQYSWCRI